MFLCKIQSCRFSLKKLFRFRYIIILLIIIIMVQLGINIYLFQKESLSYDSNSLINPNIATQKSLEFKKYQSSYLSNFNHLREDLDSYTSRVSLFGNVSVYIEDLNSGSWIGINERDRYYPGSLMKVPNAICAMKKVETSNISLETKQVVKEKDLNFKSGVLAFYDDILDKEFTLQQLLIFSLGDSDNTAAALVEKFCTDKEFIDASLASGLTDSYLEGEVEGLSPRSYSNLFRTLYNSGYLKRPNSELLLSIMANSAYYEGLAFKIKDNIIISHKVGIIRNRNQYHDCGIVYEKENPYLICVMTKGYTYEEAQDIISQISKITYDHIKSY